MWLTLCLGIYQTAIPLTLTLVLVGMCIRRNDMTYGWLDLPLRRLFAGDTEYMGESWYDVSIGEGELSPFLRL